jgi:sugar O-acyltransferase (sialic acid O-acetyltransferase NeuD family)
MKSIIIIGAGGLGCEVLATLRNPLLASEYNVIGFMDDGVEKGSLINGVEVLGTLSTLPLESDCSVIIAIGNPRIRKEAHGKLSAHKNLIFPTIKHPNASIQALDYCKIGKGCFIAEGAILTSRITIGDFCLINIGCSIHHDTTIGAYGTLMPGVRITGGATLGEGTYVGPNKVIVDPIFIPENSIL